MNQNEAKQSNFIMKNQNDALKKKMSENNLNDYEQLTRTLQNRTMQYKYNSS